MREIHRFTVLGRLRLAILLGVGLGASACATGGHNDPPLATAAESGVEQVLLLPMNLTISLPPELEGSLKPIRKMQVDYLKAHGMTVSALPFTDARGAWKQAVESSPGAPTEQVSRAFVQGLAAQHSFDVLVMPAIVTKTVRAKHTPSKWDGVKRKLRQVRPIRTKGSVVSATEISVDLPALSLLVRSYAPDGTRVFVGRGGLEFVHQIVFSEHDRRAYYDLQMRNDLLEDPEVLAEGLRAAYQPYLEPLEIP